jgi:signal transduction histidine kinase/ActR/RegA family two-component response regulator
MQGRPVADFVAPEERPRARRILEEQRLERIEMMLTHADGSSTPAEITPILTTLEESPVRLSGIRDLRVQKREQAERVALEQRIAQSQRIESLGVLAGGIAHDFNNLLLGLLGHAEWLARQIRDPEQLDALEGIRTAGERAAALTAQMLAYAGRKELGERRTIDLKNLLLELDGLLKAALSKKARLSLELQPGSFVLGDRATLTQVLMNLLTNASDALGDQVGTIGVRTELLSELPERWQTAVEPVERVAPNGYVEIRVSDDGKGMTQDMVARVFEPFFTTKGGQGHGLGLAAVHGIVRAHGGAVRVDSTVGKGSCFRVLLPLAPRGPSLAPKAADWTAGATCRVLVIDDEPLVRSFLTRALVDAGYSVEEAKDGATALDTLTRTTPDLVLLDMTLPDLDGVEILRRIRQSGHAMPVLLASGYLADDVKDTLQPGSFQGFLQKPFRIDKLLRTVDETLERTALGAKNGTSSAQTS